MSAFVLTSEWLAENAPDVFESRTTILNRLRRYGMDSVLGVGVSALNDRLFPAVIVEWQMPAVGAALYQPREIQPLNEVTAERLPYFTDAVRGLSDAVADRDDPILSIALPRPVPYSNQGTMSTSLRQRARGRLEHL